MSQQHWWHESGLFCETSCGFSILFQTSISFLLFLSSCSNEWIAQSKLSVQSSLSLTRWHLSPTNSLLVLFLCVWGKESMLGWRFSALHSMLLVQVANMMGGCVRVTASPKVFEFLFELSLMLANAKVDQLSKAGQFWSPHCQTKQQFWMLTMQR